MKFGDLSNKPARAIALNFDTIVKVEGRLNTRAQRLLDKLLAVEDINIFLFTEDDERKAMAFCYKWNLPYTKIIRVASTLEIPKICKHHAVLKYYDSDKYVLENVDKEGIDVELFNLVELYGY